MQISQNDNHKRLTLVVDNSDAVRSQESLHLAVRRREDREIKEEFFDLPLYGPSPNRMPWEFLRAA